ncbi:NhaP-type Na+(K+)/H+ antiporter [Terriglobus roseus DSM 18391]|uniref:NhaP-type Na+(K+)/H+ antiporter n=1 Tax=Terriglobus roseus (strain DSM 18391 / NRRL B-41598 / KBS 63) TaxID=926566 RepID=I3ZGR9_TERRK|nr:sodium:proton antiporter [Terriglobus roseus]AFL88437.1 NhaP-type Na+(K+)/H+ antiporter [Terriglobus roseus DSM 18391]AFL88779.1 NhaP-type Na+(K+)/H+ antiporter [Terriglobus roseus DSM 18391]
MELFEGILVLMVAAVVLLQVSRRFSLPYPSLLALAGIGVAAIPFLPNIVLEPELALAVFVTPALFDAAYDTAPRDLKKHWVPLAILAVAAVIITTVAVGVVGHTMAGLGWAAAMTLGAIVSPPDASAVSAVLSRFPLPRRTLLILEGESLLNDATALLLFGTAQAVALHGASTPGKIIGPLLLAIPGGAILGYVLGKLYLMVAKWTAGSLSASIAEIAVTFGAWILGEKLHVSPILAVVVLAMTIAKGAPKQEPPRDRVHSTALWGSITFILGAIAFLLLGMQVLDAAKHLSGVSLKQAVIFGAAVTLTTVVTRIAWVFLYRVFADRLDKSGLPQPPVGVTFLTSWCGIRGILTIATASALPYEFPGRSMIVFAAFSVVLGTLVVQGFTIGPLVKLLKIEPDESLKEESNKAREELLEVGVNCLRERTDSAAKSVRRELEIALKEAARLDFSAQSSGMDTVRSMVVCTQRERLIALRDDGEIEEDVFQLLEEELDWAALAAAPSEDLALEEV